MSFWSKVGMMKKDEGRQRIQTTQNRRWCANGNQFKTRFKYEIQKLSKLIKLYYHPFTSISRCNSRSYVSRIIAWIPSLKKKKTVPSLHSSTLVDSMSSNWNNYDELKFRWAHFDELKFSFEIITSHIQFCSLHQCLNKAKSVFAYAK